MEFDVEYRRELSAIPKIKIGKPLTLPIDRQIQTLE